MSVQLQLKRPWGCILIKTTDTVTGHCETSQHGAPRPLHLGMSCRNAGRSLHVSAPARAVPCPADVQRPHELSSLAKKQNLSHTADTAPPAGHPAWRVMQIIIQHHGEVRLYSWSKASTKGTSVLRRDSAIKATFSRRPFQEMQIRDTGW